MSIVSFKQIELESEKMYEQGNLQDALKILIDGVSLLSKEELQKYMFDYLYDKAVLYSANGMYEESLDCIEELINLGYAISNRMLERMSLKDDRRYTELKTKNDKLIEKEQKMVKMEYSVHLPENYHAEKKHPLFLALHGDGGNIDEFSSYWKPEVFLTRGFIFVYVQSSQVLHYKGRSWLSDPKIANKDIKTCYDLIIEKYSVDKDTVLIGGFSGGAITSISITMSNDVPIKGFVSLCPEIKPETFTIENVELAAKRGVKGVFMEGEKVVPIPDEEEMEAIFKEVGLPYQYYINEGIGHRAPDNFSEKLKQALTFILE